jgi:SEC-C motif-containing protein
MRARYTAYAIGEVDFVFKTHDPEKNADVDRKSTEVWSKQSQWLGFELLSSDKGGEDDDTGTIEFVARYKLRGVTVDHRARATFQRRNGAWMFVDEEAITGPPVQREGPRVGRNDPCPCGSGKKYKKCHGRAA